MIFNIQFFAVNCWHNWSKLNFVTAIKFRDLHDNNGSVKIEVLWTMSNNASCFQNCFIAVVNFDSCTIVKFLNNNLISVCFTTSCKASDLVKHLLGCGTYANYWTTNLGSQYGAGKIRTYHILVQQNWQNLHLLRLQNQVMTNQPYSNLSKCRLSA